MNKPSKLPHTTVTPREVLQHPQSVPECNSQPTEQTISQQDSAVPSSHPSDATYLNESYTVPEQSLANVNKEQEVPSYHGHPLSKPQEETVGPSQTINSAPSGVTGSDQRKEQEEDEMIELQGILSRRLSDKHSDLRKVETQLVRVQNQLARVREENLILYQKVDKLEKANAALKKDLDHVQTENLSLNQKVSELEKALARLQDETQLKASDDSLEKKLSALSTVED